LLDLQSVYRGLLRPRVIGLITSRLSKDPSENVWKISRRRAASADCKGASLATRKNADIERAGMLLSDIANALKIGRASVYRVPAQAN
jgi:hypothetical protein